MDEGVAEVLEWTPPPDPDFERLTYEAIRQYRSDNPERVAFDTETSGFEWYDEAFCVTAAWRAKNGDIVSGYFELDLYDSHNEVVEVLTANTLIGHNIKFDLHRVHNLGLLGGNLDTYVIHDTECMAHLDDEHRKKGLKDLAVSVLGYDDTIQVSIKSKPGEFKE